VAGLPFPLRRSRLFCSNNESDERMALVMTSGPGLEPVTVSGAKAHLRLDSSAEDLLIASLILTSRLHIEAALGLALISQSWTLTLDRWPDGHAVTLPLRPVQAIEEVRVRDAAGDAVVVDPVSYVLDGQGVPARLLRCGVCWHPSGHVPAGIDIDVVAGFGDAASDVPEPIRHAVLLLVAHWYEHRDPIEIGAAGTAIPRPVSELLAPYRAVRL
jgi:uncharacterized phiE125 gp8 family phage protein